MVSIASKMTLETIMRFQRDHAYVKDKLFMIDWVDWICMLDNFPVYDHVPSQSR